MKEILKRIFYSPIVIFELLTTTTIVNILSLSSSIFVILVLNRYVSYGLDGTLLTLTLGVVLAVILEFLFRRLRFRFAARALTKKYSNFSGAAFNKLIFGNVRSIVSLPVPFKRKQILDAESLDNFYSPNNLSIFLDAPFSILFVAVIYVANKDMAYIVAGLCAIYFIFGLIGSYGYRSKSTDFEQPFSSREQLIESAVLSQDTLKLFGIGKRISLQWSEFLNIFNNKKVLQRDKENSIQSSIKFLAALTTVIVISVGARIVVEGSMSIGVLIGINILAARATMPVLSFAQLIERYGKYRKDKNSLNKFLSLPNSNDGSLELSNFNGCVTVSKLEFSYIGSKIPILKDLHFQINPGDILVVRGKNGSGKTTLSNILCGVFPPTLGSVLVDDINLQQISNEWWSKQIIYMPQEPTFLTGSILENFLANKADASVQEIRMNMQSVGLGHLCEETDLGLNLHLFEGGKNLSVGVRRRLALARALIYDGPLVILDEPTESLDLEGKNEIYKLLNKFVEQKKTIICFSIDPEVVKGASHVLDIDTDSTIKIINQR